MRFTKPNLATLDLPVGASDAIFFDDTLPGFGVRIRRGGKRTWIVQYRVGAKQRRLTLGSLSSLELDQARIEARRALAKVGLAVDPQAEKSRTKREAAVTMDALFDRYLKVKEAQLKPRSFVETERHLLKGWAPLHSQPIASIERADIASRLSVLARDSGPVSADRARAALSGFFSWAMREGLVGMNPVLATNRPATSNPRDRILSDSEIAEVWSAGADNDFGRIVRLLLLTGQRREEVSSMAWSELDLDAAIWSIPRARTKNDRAHVVPLSDPALAIIANIIPRLGRDLVFGEGAGGFSGWSKAKAALDRRINAQRERPIPPWRLHDLRRTAVTGMGELNVAPHVIEAVVNHVSGSKGGVAGIYNRALHMPERRQALTLWAERVLGLVDRGKSTVIPMRRA